MTPLSISPIAAVLRIGAAGNNQDSVPLAGFSCQFNGDSPNTAMASLAIGYIGRQGGRVVERLTYERGTPAYIDLEVSDYYIIGGASNPTPHNNFRIFSGYVDDIGPGNLTGGSFTVDARLNGRLNKLNSGTLQSGLYTGGEFTDFSGLAASLTDQIPIVFDKSLCLADLGIGFLSGLYGMSTNTSAINNTIAGRLLADVFGNTPNSDAAAVLSGIDSYVNWRSDLSDGFRAHIVNLLESWNLTDFKYDSFYTRLQQIGGQLGFRLYETGNWLALVPYTPFVASGRCTVIRPDTYVAVGREVGDARQYTGCALAATRDCQAITPFAGLYKRPGDGPGQILTTDAPTYLRTNAPGLAGASTMRPTDQANSSYVTAELAAEVGNAVAREILMSRNYASRVYTIQSPYLRPEIAPLMPVKLTYPQLPGVPSTQAIYGSVTSVNVTVDAQSPSVTTTIRVGYARSALQQQQEVDDTEYADRPHPVWSSAFLGLRLDEPVNGVPHRIVS